MAHDHHHASAGADHRGRLVLVLALTTAVLVVQVVGAVVTGSLALLADAGHALTDVAGLAMAVLAATLARRPVSERRTWGFRRAEVVAAAAQAAVLLAVGGFVLVEGVRRLVEPPEIASGALLVFGLVGLLVNLASLGVLLGSRGSNLNLRAAFLEVLNDALGSLAVVVAAVVIATTGFQRADAVASLVIAGLIVPRTLLLLRDSVEVLMESTPRGLDLGEVRRRVQALDHVLDVHDLHASQVATGLPVLTAHVVVDDECFASGHVPQLLDAVQSVLSAEFDVEHSTVQFETVGHGAHERGTHP